MRLRADGVETRKRILSAACEVFAARGYTQATVAAICRRAGANSAAINYHFKDKESLYVEVWRSLAAEAMRLYPLHGGVASNAPARERLRGFVLSLLQRMTDRGRLGAFHRLRTLEMASPTGLMDRVRWELVRPMREYIRQILVELLGDEVGEQEIRFCELNLVGPCVLAQLTCQQPGRMPAPALFQPGEVQAFAAHCAEFVIAGLESVRARQETSRVAS